MNCWNILSNADNIPKSNEKFQKHFLSIHFGNICKLKTSYECSFRACADLGHSHGPNIFDNQCDKGRKSSLVPLNDLYQDTPKFIVTILILRLIQVRCLIA